MFIEFDMYTVNHYQHVVLKRVKEIKPKINAIKSLCPIKITVLQ